MVLELAPNDFEAWFDYAETLYEMKRYDEALNAYETAIALEPAWPDAHYGRAKLLYREDNFFEAAVELLITFRLEPMKVKQYETEFPTLGKEADFAQMDAVIRAQMLEAAGEEEE